MGDLMLKIPEGWQNSGLGIGYRFSLGDVMLKIQCNYNGIFFFRQGYPDHVQIKRSALLEKCLNLKISVRHSAAKNGGGRERESNFFGLS